MPPKNSIAAPNLQLLEASQRHRLDLLPLPVNRVTPGRERETQSGKKQPKRSRARRAHLYLAPPNGSRLSCGRNGRGRKAVERQTKRLAGEATQFLPTCDAPGSFKRLLGSA